MLPLLSCSRRARSPFFWPTASELAGYTRVYTAAHFPLELNPLVINPPRPSLLYFVTKLHDLLYVLLVCRARARAGHGGRYRRTRLPGGTQEAAPMIKIKHLLDAVEPDDGQRIS